MEKLKRYESRFESSSYVLNEEQSPLSLWMYEVSKITKRPSDAKTLTFTYGVVDNMYYARMKQGNSYVLIGIFRSDPQRLKALVFQPDNFVPYKGKHPGRNLIEELFKKYKI